MKYKISSIASIISGGTPKKNIPEYWNGTIPWITIKDFNSKYVSSVTNYISKKGLDNSSVNLTRNNDILISARGTVGKLLMVESGMTFNQSIYCIRPNEQLVIPDYLYYWLCKNIEKIKKGVHGSVFDTITRKTFDLIEINLPSLQLQKEISKKVKVLDDKIELNRRINANLVKIINTNLKKLYVQSSQNNVVKLKEIAKVNNGYAFKSKELLDSPQPDSKAIFKMGNIIAGGGINHSATKSWIKRNKWPKDKYLAKKGDILMSMTDVKDNMKILGNTALMDKDNNYFVNQRVAIIRPISVPFEFLYPLTNYGSFNQELRKTANHGVQVNLTIKAIRNMLVNLPNNDELNNYILSVKPLFKSIFNLQKQNESLESLKKQLLNNLF